MSGGGGNGPRRARLSGPKKQVLDSVRNDINVTPLVDVVLVLLIICMVLAPLMARGREVPLPKTRNFSSETDKLQPVVALDKDANLWYDKEKLGPINDGNIKRMEEMIKRNWENPKNPGAVGRVYVKADETLPMGKVRPLIMAVNNMGVQTIELATNELKDGK